MEHLEGIINKPEAQMSPQELQLHYFKMHDYDGNNLLDGLELSTAITHVHKEVGEAVVHGAVAREGLPLGLQSPGLVTCAVLVHQCYCFSFFCSPLCSVSYPIKWSFSQRVTCWGRSPRPCVFNRCHRHFCCTPEFANQCPKDRPCSQCRAGEKLFGLRRVGNRKWGTERLSNHWRFVRSSKQSSL